MLVKQKFDLDFLAPTRVCVLAARSTPLTSSGNLYISMTLCNINSDIFLVIFPEPF